MNGCVKPVKGKGWCSMHLARWTRHGDPSVTLYCMGEVDWGLLLSRSKENKETGCIEWQRGTSSGYGDIRFKGRSDRAHRVSYILNVGQIPKGLCVCHVCDNRLCINPDHLFLGTHADNQKDKIEKGRVPSGEHHWNSKLTKQDVISIRSDRRAQVLIARQYQVNPSTVSYIKSGKIWRTV